MPNNTKGFASLTAKERSAIAQRGGKAAHRKGTAHEWTHEEAVEAGRKGAKARAQYRRQRGEGATTESGNMNYPPA